jgi:hypothetical protein
VRAALTTRRRRRRRRDLFSVVTLSLAVASVPAIAARLPPRDIRAANATHVALAAQSTALAGLGTAEGDVRSHPGHGDFDGFGQVADAIAKGPAGGDSTAGAPAASTEGAGSGTESATGEGGEG